MPRKSVGYENRQIIVDRKAKEGYAEETKETGKVLSKVIKGFWVQAEWLLGKRLPDLWACWGEILGTAPQKGG